MKSDFLRIRSTQERLQRWREAAAKAKDFEDDDDLDFSAWVRRTLNEAMEREAKRYEKRGKGGGR